MKVRGTPPKSAAVSTLIAAALLITALVAVIGSAQAAPSTKNYSVTVRLKSTSPSTVLTITMTNDRSSKQTLGSAQFTAPVNTTPSAPTVTFPTSGWQASILPGRIVKLTSTTPLKPGDSLTADVTLTNSGCTDATWGAAAKQSNDFSGAGNDFTLSGSTTNLRPLGSLAFVNKTVATDPAIGTYVDDPGTQAVEQLFVPQIAIPGPAAAVNVAAFDLCGAPYPKYGSTFGASAAVVRTGDPPTPARLVHATIPAIVWSTASTGATVGTGSTTLDPATGETETSDLLVLDDQFTDITGTSNVFDVVEKLCTVFDDTCHWNNGNNKIQVDAAPPTDPDASLGIGFVDDASFDCAGGTSALGGQLIYINPRDYPSTEGQSVDITYDKTVPGTSGNVANFGSCISKDNGGTWTAIGTCEHNPPILADAATLPCIQNRARVQGNLVITLFFNPSADPVHGGR